MSPSDEDQPTDGRFVPLLGTSFEQPAPKQLFYVCIGGVTVCTNPQDNTSGGYVPSSLAQTTVQPTEGDAAANYISGACAFSPSAAPPAHQILHAQSANAHEEDSVEYGTWHHQALTAPQQPSMLPASEEDLAATTADETSQHSLSRSAGPIRTVIYTGFGIEQTLEPHSTLPSNFLPTVDPHQALAQASLPSPGDDAAMARFEAERSQRAARTQKHKDKRAARTAARQISGIGMQQPSKAAWTEAGEGQQDMLSGDFMNTYTGAMYKAQSAVEEGLSQTFEAQEVADGMTTTMVSGEKSISKMSRAELKTAAAAGDERAVAELGERRTAGRNYYKQAREKMANGDAAAIARYHKQSERSKNVAQMLRQKASEGNPEAIARYEEQKAASRDWGQQMRLKASQGDEVAIARREKGKQQAKDWMARKRVAGGA